MEVLTLLMTAVMQHVHHRDASGWSGPSAMSSLLVCIAFTLLWVLRCTGYVSTLGSAERSATASEKVG